MEIEYDPEKSAKNAAERGLPFDTVKRFDWQSAWIAEDIRFAYPETRYIAYGLLDGRLHALVFAETAAGIRVISLRKANKREVKTYESHP